MSSTSYTVVDGADGAWADEADVVIVGLGCAGACAAIEAKAAGANVLVLERASGGGGVTAMAAGHIYLGGGTRVQKAVGVEDAVEDMIRYLVLNTPDPDEAKIRAYCEQSVEHFDWLVAQGVPFNDTMYKGKHVLQMTDECLIWSGNEELWPFCNQAKPAPRGHKIAQVGEGGGAKLMECLIARVQQMGVRVVTDAHVHELARENGRIRGVGYRVFGKQQGRVRARKAVILATGQFTENEQMLAKYLPQLLDERYTRQYTPSDDGAGHQLGEAAGGVLKHMDGALITSPFYPPEDLIKGVLVNKRGKRFVAEDSYHSRSSIFATRQPDAVAWLIVDDSIYSEGPLFGGYPVVDAWETVEQMEKGLGLANGSLQQTLHRYNEYAAKGEDPDFHKAAKWLKPLRQPPFAALDGSLGSSPYMSFTLGGLDVSIDGEVRDARRAVIPGLYAIGGCASNIAQDGTGYSSGTCIGESTYFGRRAGRHAARRNG